MCTTDTSDCSSTIRQIHMLESAGCEIIRVAVPDMIAAKALKKIKKAISIPLVADIHFDYRLALEAVRQGVDKIRINPGTIGSEKKVKEIVKACADHNTAIRIGVNAGSLLYLKQSDAWKTMDFQTRAEHMVQEAVLYVHLLESWGFYNLVISLKAADVRTTIAAYRLMSKKCAYPLHIGITEAGSGMAGVIKSSIGLGILLAEGIGETIRVSLTDNPAYEIKTAQKILQTLGLRLFGPDIISCPMCARCTVDITGVVKKLEHEIDMLRAKKVLLKPIKIAVMGCVVNGPGEARDADIGIAGSKKGEGVLFKYGKPIKKIKAKYWLQEILKEIKK